MSGISIALLVFFIIVAFLIVGLVLLQNEEGDSLGGLFSGGSNSAFGSRSGNILTRATYTLITLFFVVTFFLAWLNKSPGDSGLQQDAQIQQAETATEWWKEASSDANGTGNIEDTETAPQSSEGTAAENTSH
ncbi:preprotein translocase subunit SecG [Treponema medium]|uniref:Protein-export membrane protein SecG n=2 Tax=Treponema medium TaxID=58231 RepID=A0AA87TG01_TREMD|nr:preprotein translocase subunit SecG [Treponema medium]EPF30119.1 preprotein translocase, SecG subunit [Treponema medium ATCC 700293]QSH96299.1 preprotein translocase subunit SecG [Treponema medium]